MFQLQKPSKSLHHTASESAMCAAVVLRLCSAARRWAIRPQAWLLAGLLGLAGPAWAVPTFAEVKRDYQSSDTLILSAEGRVVQRLRTDATVRRGQWVPLEDVSPAMRLALLVSEDKRFYEHSGVDWQAVSAAAWGNLWNQRTRGASTVTMQLAGLLDGDWRQSPGGRSVVQKLGQAVTAQVLDRRWSKSEILESYLNLVPFRGELVGIDALSRTLFGKAAHGLNERESAVAAALIRAPNARAALVTQRACGVLRDMRQSLRQPAGADLCEALDMFTASALQRRSFDRSEGIAPHFARYVLRQNSVQALASKPSASDQARKPAPVKTAVRNKGAAQEGDATPQQITSLRFTVQNYAVQSLQKHLRELRGRNVEDGAVLVLDNATGQVLAWVGSSGDLSQAQEVDGVLARRQPGSTLKPFLYAQAIAEKRLTAASLIEDSPANIPTASGLYIPQNYDRNFKGWVSVRTALASSLNVPAVRALVMVTPDAFFRQLQAVGIQMRETGDFYGYSLALGSAEVSLLDLTNGYRTLANSGRMSPVLTRTPGVDAAITTPVTALSPSAAFIVGDILADNNARARTFGTDSVLATRFWTAVKTGTSKDMRDNWAVGYSSRYTVGVWVGNASGAAMHDVSGSSGAAPIWADVMAFLHRGQSFGTAANVPAIPLPPPGVVQQAVSFGSRTAAPNPSRNVASAAKPMPVLDAIESPRLEWFVPGTQQALFALDLGAASASPEGAAGPKSAKPPTDGQPRIVRGGARIVSPAPGTVIALDPDIPFNRQRVPFKASDARVRWQLNGEVIGSGRQFLWLPWPGRYHLQLIDQKGQIVDEVPLEVRGAGVLDAKNKRPR